MSAKQDPTWIALTLAGLSDNKHETLAVYGTPELGYTPEVVEAARKELASRSVKADTVKRAVRQLVAGMGADIKYTDAEVEAIHATISSVLSH